MPGEEGLHQVERLRPSNLAHDQTVGAHTQCGANQRTEIDCSETFGGGRSALEADDMFSRQSQLSRVFDRDEPVTLGDRGPEGIEQGRLATPRRAEHEDRASILHRRA